jgi:hypothetical protein
MSTLSCRFCSEANPAGARFCNGCGSPLHLKPCPKCEAITDLLMGSCHQCGYSFDAEQSDEAADAVPSARAAPGAIDPGRVEDGPVPDEPLHTPESFAKSLNMRGGMDLLQRAEPALRGPDREADRAFAHEPPEDQEAPGRERVSACERAAMHRGTSFRRASVAVALIAIAAVAYYGHLFYVPSGESGSEVSVASDGGGEGAATPSGTSASEPSSRPSTTRDELRTGALPAASVVAGPPLAAMPRVAPAGPASDVPADASVKRNAASEQQSPPPTPPGMAPKGNRTGRQADAIATQRLTEREMAGFARPQSPATPGTTDRDAIETRRLINRDLGVFLSPGSTGRPDVTSSSSK